MNVMVDQRHELLAARWFHCRHHALLRNRRCVAPKRGQREHRILNGGGEGSTEALGR